MPQSSLHPVGHLNETNILSFAASSFLMYKDEALACSGPVAAAPESRPEIISHVPPSELTLIDLALLPGSSQILQPGRMKSAMSCPLRLSTEAEKEAAISPSPAACRPEQLGHGSAEATLHTLAACTLASEELSATSFFSPSCAARGAGPRARKSWKLRGSPPGSSHPRLAASASSTHREGTCQTPS